MEINPQKEIKKGPLIEKIAFSSMEKEFEESFCSI
jgi:hypothetical protein